MITPNKPEEFDTVILRDLMVQLSSGELNVNLEPDDVLTVDPVTHDMTITNPDKEGFKRVIYGAHIQTYMEQTRAIRRRKKE